MSLSVFKTIICSVLLVSALSACSAADPLKPANPSLYPSPSPVSGESQPDPLFPVQAEPVHITIPGMKGDVKLIYLSDLHIVVLNDEIAPDEKENVALRRSIFSNQEITSDEQWAEWVSLLNGYEADYLLFGADMIDYNSEATVSVLEKGLKELKLPYMYIRADHDTEPYYLKDPSVENSLRRQNRLCENKEVLIKEFPDFLIIGWNNSTSQLTSEGLELIEEALRKEKPAILLTHVPIEPLKDESLSELSRLIFANRSLLWGFGENETVPNETTSALLEMIYAKDSPFVAVLCGHLHYSWDGKLSDRVQEHVFGPAFYGYYGEITVSGE